MVWHSLACEQVHLSKFGVAEPPSCEGSCSWDGGSLPPKFSPNSHKWTARRLWLLLSICSQALYCGTQLYGHPHEFVKVSEASFNARAWGRATTERATKSRGRRFWPEWISIILSIQAGKKWLTYAVLGAAWNLAHYLIGQLSWHHQ